MNLLLSEWTYYIGWWWPDVLIIIDEYVVIELPSCHRKRTCQR